MKTLEVHEGNAIGEGRWRVGNRTLDEVVLTLQIIGKPASEVILHNERISWRRKNPNPLHRLDKPSIQQTRDDLKAGLDAGVLSFSFDKKWWFDAAKLGLEV